MPAEPIAGVRRIAVLRANALGDLVVTLPALEALHAAYPDAELVLLGRPLHRALLEGRPGPVDRVEVVPVGAGVRTEPGEHEDAAELEAFLARMRAERFDVAVQLHGGGRHANPFVRRLGARVTVGLRAPDAPPLDRWLRYVPEQPEAGRFLDVAALAGAPAEASDPRLVVTAADRAGAREHLGADPPPYAVLHPGALHPPRRWPPERFARVGEHLHARGLALVVTGSAEERPIAEALASAMRAPALDLCGRLSLPALVGVLAGARLVAGNDTGPLHVAGAVGTPAAAVYWFPNLFAFGPRSRRRLRTLVSWQATCPRCGADVTPGAAQDERCHHDDCLVEPVRVEDVLAAVDDLLDGAQSP